MLLATLPAPHLQQIIDVTREPLVEGYRFNVGVRTPNNPKETLRQILANIGGKPLWIDLKGRQLRIVEWSVPTFGDIKLNHEIKVDLPATIVFRGNNKSTIVEIRGNKIFVDPDPPEAVGAGQAINIHGTNLEITGYLTSEDIEYIKAAIELGINRYMLSFVEKASDIEELLALDPKAEIYAKIESPKGLQFVEKIYPALQEKINLIAALDDLYTNIGEDKTAIFDALNLIIKADPKAIAASRIFTSLEKDEIVSISDLTNFYYLETIGYRSFMLSDGLCTRANSFKRVILTIKQYQKRFKK